MCALFNFKRERTAAEMTNEWKIFNFTKDDCKLLFMTVT